MNPKPTSPSTPSTPAEQAGHAIAEVVAADQRTRLWVKPPFDKLPPLPGRPPNGIVIRPTDIHIHLAVNTSHILQICRELTPKLLVALRGTPYQHNPIHLFIDHLSDD